jgi:hypothetical protein
MAMKPGDVPEGSKFEITVVSNSFIADFFPDRFAPVFTGSGSGNTIEGAVREALDAAGE